MKPPAPHTSTVVPAPLPIVIGIVSGRLVPRVQLRVKAWHVACARGNTHRRMRIRPAASRQACAAPPSRTRTRARARVRARAHAHDTLFVSDWRQDFSSSTPLPPGYRRKPRARLCALR